MSSEKQQMLMAFVDGELDETTSRNVTRILETDPQAQEIVRIYRESADWLRLNIGEIESLPVPEKLLRGAGADTPDAIPLSQGRRSGGRRVFPWNPVALAASIALMVGYVFGAFISPMQRGGTGDGGHLFVAEALETAPAGSRVSDLESAISVMPMATFQTSDAGFCREYEKQADDAIMVGVACREGSGEWVTRFEMRENSSKGHGDEYVAASGAVDLVSEFLDYIAAGAALDAAAERRILDGGWDKLKDAN